MLFIMQLLMGLAPLAERMRPKHLSDYIGQEHLTGQGAILRKVIESGQLHSLILWGPPGVGKTTLAQIIAAELKRPFYMLSAVHSGVKDVREMIEKAKKTRFMDSPPPILFIDEIHRFSKSQQDALLSAVENGTVVLMGATTENPSFEVIAPLLSRCQVYVLKPLGKNELMTILQRAIEQDVVLKKMEIHVLETEAILRYSGGDARKLLNILEIVVQAHPSESGPVEITNETVTRCITEKIALYDKAGEQHYDIISAFIKSVRGSDPNGAVYWLARMLEGGEDILFIARRMIILAAEDIGLANPNALLLANACFQAVHQVGMPEARIILSETAIYLATSPKSNSAYMAIEKALDTVKTTGDLSVPLAIRNAPTQLMKELGYGKDYKYAHDYEGNFVQEEFLPPEIRSLLLYEPQDNAREKEIAERLKRWWKNKYPYSI